MNSVFILHHSYEMNGREETKLIGIYTSSSEAMSAIERLKGKPGFRDRPDDFIFEEYELNQDHWAEGYSIMTTILVKDINGNWKPVAAALLSDGNYEIVERYENDMLGEFKDGDIVRCEIRDDVPYAVAWNIPKSIKELIDSYQNRQRLFSELEFENGESLSGLNLSGSTFKNCWFIADFSRANLTDCKFIDCNLKTSDFSYANLTGATIMNCLVESTVYKEAIIDNFTFQNNWSYGNNLNQSDFEAIYLER